MISDLAETLRDEIRNRAVRSTWWMTSWRKNHPDALFLPIRRSQHRKQRRTHVQPINSNNDSIKVPSTIKMSQNTWRHHRTASTVNVIKNTCSFPGATRPNVSSERGLFQDVTELRAPRLRLTEVDPSWSCETCESMENPSGSRSSVDKRNYCLTLVCLRATVASQSTSILAGCNLRLYRRVRQRGMSSSEETCFHWEILSGILPEFVRSPWPSTTKFKIALSLESKQDVCVKIWKRYFTRTGLTICRKQFHRAGK